MKNNLYLFGLLIVAGLTTSCDTEPDAPEPEPEPTPSLDSTFGFGILQRLPGIWNGPVTSVTALGGYLEWIVDLRPISENQVSAKNELNLDNDIFLSYFVAKHNNAYRVAFRNGGLFAGQKRVSYFLADSVNESPTQAYYRFSEAVIGKTRAYTEVIFSADSMYVRSYTNKYNTQPNATLHMEWRAKLQDATTAQTAIQQFNFPKKTLTRDFSESFTGTEAVYFSLTDDPYPDQQQPYLGTANIGYSYAGGFVPDPSKKVFLIITAQPLISGFSLNFANLKYRSRYVILNATDPDFSFTLMHPGGYYLYALYDADGNNTFSSGDRVSTTNVGFTVSETAAVSATASINFTLP